MPHNPLSILREAEKRPILSAVLSDQTLVEAVLDPFEQTTRLVRLDGAEIKAEKSVRDGNEQLVPYAAENTLLRNRVVLLPSWPNEYGTQEVLARDIEEYIARYVALSPSFLKLAAQYVLFSWVHDRFNELPYLRLHGEYGTGKTRFLLVVGSICRTPIFASGASTVSPLFHMLNRFGGTLLLDEADFRMSDERAQIAKILNNGNVRGFPVLRSESANGKEFAPRAYQVFGPKIVAMRGEFDDRALESRFITERSGAVKVEGIPLNLPPVQAEEALTLRNKLLLWRLRNWERFGAVEAVVDPALEPRINQVFSPLLSIMDDEASRVALRDVAFERSRAVREERAGSREAQILAVIRYLAEQPGASMPVARISSLHARAFPDSALLSARAIGFILRKRLSLQTEKRHGVYVVPPSERAKFEALFARFVVSAEDADIVAAHDPDSTRVDLGDFGDFPRTTDRPAPLH